MTHRTSPLLESDLGFTVQSLGSGSSGNAFIVTAGSECLLIDCGVGIRTLKASLADRQICLGDIDTICVTHEHSDHIRTLSKVVNDDTVLIATRGTGIRSSFVPDQHQIVRAHTPVKVGSITIWPLPVAHDAQEPCGFMLEMPDGSRVTMLTDIGSWHESLQEFVAASDLIILEANHDEEMLRRGPYPQYLKRRVASDVGHLSNRHCGVALATALRGTTHEPEIWLAHLSEHNNLAYLAENTVREALLAADVDLNVTTLPRKTPSAIWRSDRSDRSPSGFRLAGTNASPTQLSLDLLV